MPRRESPVPVKCHGQVQFDRANTEILRLPNLALTARIVWHLYTLATLGGRRESSTLRAFDSLHYMPDKRVGVLLAPPYSRREPFLPLV